MKLSVKARIALVMTVVVTLNVVAGAISWGLYRSAAQSGAQARVAAERARMAAVASAGITEFMASSFDLALAVTRKAAPEEESMAYDAVTSAEPYTNRSITLLAAKVPGDAGSGALREWSSLRSTVFAWINSEASAAGTGLRITGDPNGLFRQAVSSNLTLPAELAGMRGGELRQAVRDLADGFKYSTLGDIVEAADADAAAAAEAEARARLTAQQGTIALLGLSALIAAILGIGLYRSIARPLSAAKRYADKVASGEYETAPPTHTADEIGVLTHAVENMKNNLVREMSVMREMAGAVMVTAEAVEEAVTSTGALVDRPDQDTALVKAGLADVQDRVDTLQGLSRQMLGM